MTPGLPRLGTWRRWLLVLATACPGGLAAMEFNQASPLAANREIVRRLLSPLDAERVFQAMDSRGLALPEQTIVLSKERFSVFVPPGPPPPSGHGLLVWVPPVDPPGVPEAWKETLMRHHVIHVVAHRSGNDQDMIGRRIPLALHAVENVRRALPVDPARTWVGGFSGGSRTAMRLALSYPDVFRGAILNAGSDPFGDAAIAVPPADLFRRFQRASRVVMVTGTRDLDEVLARDEAFRHSARRLCVRAVVAQTKAGAGHERMDGRDLDRALAALSRPLPDPDSETDCDRALAMDIDRDLAEAEAAIAGGDRKRASQLLSRLDEQYGGLVGSRLLQAARLLPAPEAVPDGRP